MIQILYQNDTNKDLTATDTLKLDYEDYLLLSSIAFRIADLKAKLETK